MNHQQKECLKVLGCCYLKNRKNDKAIALFRALTALFPGEPELAAALAQAHLQKGDFDPALHLAEDLVRRGGPTRPAAYLLAAKAHWGLGRREPARTCFRQALALGGLLHEH